MAAKRDSTRNTTRQRRDPQGEPSALFNTMSQGVIYHDADGKITSANPSAERILGLTLDQMRGRTSMDPRWRTIRGDGSDFPGNEHPAVVALRTGKPVNDVLMGVFHPKEEAYRWILVSAIPEFEAESGQPTRVLATFTDVTDRTKAESSLKERDAQLASIFRAAPVGIGMVINRIIQEANESLCQMTGYSRHELLGQSARILYATDEEFNFVGSEKYRQIGERGTGAVETQWKRKDGSMIHIILSSTPLHPEDLSKGVTFTALDISHRKQIEKELKVSEERWQFALEGAGDGVWDWNAVTNEVFFSRQWKAMLGYEEHEIGNTLDEWDSRVHPDDKANVYREIEKHFKGETPIYVSEHRALCKDKTYKWILDRGKVISRTNDGKPLRVVGMHTDITERKQAEDALRESEMRMRTIVDGAPFGAHSYELHPDGRLTFSGGNRSADKILGFDHSSLIGKTIEEAFPPLATTSIPNIYRHVAATGKSYEADQVDYEDDRIRGAFEIHSFQTGPNRMTVFFRDITERKRAEETLKDSEERLRTIIETEPECVKVVDRDGQLLEMNAAGLIMLEAHTLRDVQQHTLLNFILPEYRPAFRSLHERVMNGESGILEFEITGLRGTRRWLETHAAPMRNAIGEIIRLLGVTRDITERKRAEGALRDNEERYRNLVENISEIFFIVNHQGKIVYGSPNLFSNTGYEEGELIGRSYVCLIAKEDRRRVVEFYKQRTLEGTNDCTCEFLGKSKDGRTTWVEQVTRIIRSESGSAAQYWNVVRDITERKRAEERLLASEVRYRRLFEAAKDGILILDANSGVVIDVNPFLIELLGSSSEEICGKALWELGFFKDIVANKANFLELQQKKHIRYENLPLETAHGQQIDVEFVSNVYQVDHHKVIQCNIRDITERRRAEQALRESERRYQTITEASPVGIFHTDATGYTTYVNPRWCQLSGLSAEEAQGDGWLRAVHVADREQLGQGWKESTQARKESVAEYRFVRPNGTVAWVMGQAVPELDSRNKILGYIGTVTDITDRKRAEETGRLLSHTMEGISEIATITDLEDRLTFVNEAFLRTYGYDRSEVLGRHVEILWSPNNPPELLNEILSQTRTGSWRGEILNLTKVGREFPLSLHTSQVKDEHGKIIGLVGISEDITARKQLEAQLHQAQKMEAIGRLAGGVAHDFNNMIGVILGYAKLMENQLNPFDPLQKNVKAIAGAAERSANLTKQLLAFARKQVIAPVSLNLNDSISTLHKMLMRLIGEDITLTLLPENNLWNTKIDPTQVDQILANLATNARDAINDVGTITMETANTSIDQSFVKEHPDFTPGDYVMLAFSDNGKGMDKATQERIFEPFFTTKPKGQGTGLGLATVFGIIKQNNGFIHVYSEPDKGSTFKLYLPRFYGGTEAPTEKREEVPLKGTETILVVEDEEQLLELSCAALEMFGYTVLSAKSPGEAIVLCERTDKKIDLLVTDVVMPGMNGKELKERLDTLKPGMRTIFMSGYTADVVANRGILDEGVLFLQKPFTPMTLARKVREVLNG